MIRSCFAVLAISCSSLTLAAAIGRAMPQQPDAQQEDAKPKASTAEEKAKGPEQPAGDADSESHPPLPRSFKALGKEFLLDQEQIWTSPTKLRLSDAQWLLPLSGIGAGLFVTDRDFSSHLSHDPATLSRYSNISNAGLGAFVGGAGGMWLLGHVKHNDH